MNKKELAMPELKQSYKFPSLELETVRKSL